MCVGTVILDENPLEWRAAWLWSGADCVVFFLISLSFTSSVRDAGLNTRVTERGPALVLGGLLHTRWPLVCSCEVKLRNVANLIGEARYTPATQQKWNKNLAKEYETEDEQTKQRKANSRARPSFLVDTALVFANIVALKDLSRHFTCGGTANTSRCFIRKGLQFVITGWLW